MVKNGEVVASLLLLHGYSMVDHGSRLMMTAEQWLFDMVHDGC